MKPARRWPLAAVALTAAFFLLDAAWIPVKAQLAQVLLERAWQRTLAGEADPRPWPWADTHPVGILEAPRLGIRQVVLDGASGRNLAFGPAALAPIGGRDIVLSGHRDTHFRFLQALQNGDVLRLVTRAETLQFRVSWMEVVDSRDRVMVMDNGPRRLTLLTCFPFDAPFAGGPLRYVVTALAVARGA